MKILMIGDIFGRPGRRALRELLDPLIDEHDIDFVVANGENAAGGFGLTRSIVDELFRYGVHVITGGNHTFDKREILAVLEEEERVLRPHNYPAVNPGAGTVLVRHDGIQVAVLNVQGRAFMPPIDCPFRAIDRLIDDIRDEADIILVDLHAEATSEKLAMAWYLDGRASALVGTHTHVQTADERVFPKGMAYITDLGMTGPHESILGVKVQQSLGRFLDARPTRFEVATGDVQLQGVLLNIDEETGRARSIKRIQSKLNPK